jgi:hypothetical protein
VLQFGFVIFWRKDFGVKAAHKMLVQLTPGGIIVVNVLAADDVAIFFILIVVIVVVVFLPPGL